MKHRQCDPTTAKASCHRVISYVRLATRQRRTRSHQTFQEGILIVTEQFAFEFRAGHILSVPKATAATTPLANRPQSPTHQVHGAHGRDHSGRVRASCHHPESRPQRRLSLLRRQVHHPPRLAVSRHHPQRYCRFRAKHESRLVQPAATAIPANEPEYPLIRPPLPYRFQSSPRFISAKISNRERSIARWTSPSARNQSRGGPSQNRCKIVSCFGFGNSFHRARTSGNTSTLELRNGESSPCGSPISMSAATSAGSMGSAQANKARRLINRKGLSRQFSRTRSASAGDFFASRSRDQPQRGQWRKTPERCSFCPCFATDGTSESDVP